MRWRRGNVSGDIEDLRSSGGGRRPRVALGLGGLVVLGVLSLVFKTDLISPFMSVGEGTAPSVPDPLRDAREQESVEFVSFVLDDAQSVWGQQMGNYRKAKLVLFRDGVQSACGAAESSAGPFYCPADEKVYLDLGFFDELRTRFRAPGEFAAAYVVAHEIGHHVQNVLGIERRLRALQRQDPSSANELSVKMELQADCLAGVWAHSTAQRQLLESGDLESGLGAAAAVGDDRIQKEAMGRVHPESFTHGTSAQRMQWFSRGYERGDAGTCETFN
ncbi:MAG TPA: neutral zinc metallopeptidase [Bryobacteraceae bacterium]|nr:neutral zinc metallopeptidase [Bryobacteraceae bacterium]